MQVTLEGWLALAAIGGDRTWHAAGAAPDPPDGGRELRAVAGGIARTRAVRSSFCSAALAHSASFSPGHRLLAAPGGQLHQRGRGGTSRELRDLFNRAVGAGQGLRRQWEDPRNAVRGECAQRPMSVVVRCVHSEDGRQLPFADGGPLHSGQASVGVRDDGWRLCGLHPRRWLSAAVAIRVGALGFAVHDGTNPVTLVTAPPWVGTRCARSVARSRPPVGVDHLLTISARRPASRAISASIGSRRGSSCSAGS